MAEFDNTKSCQEYEDSREIKLQYVLFECMNACLDFIRNCPEEIAEPYSENCKDIHLQKPLLLISEFGREILNIADIGYSRSSIIEFYIEHIGENETVKKSWIISLYIHLVNLAYASEIINYGFCRRLLNKLPDENYD